MILPITVEIVDNKHVRLIVRSPFSHDEKALIVAMSHDEFQASQEKLGLGANMQDAFSALSAEERDFMMIGVLPDESDEFYANLED